MLGRADTRGPCVPFLYIYAYIVERRHIASSPHAWLGYMSWCLRLWSMEGGWWKSAQTCKVRSWRQWWW